MYTLKPNFPLDFSITPSSVMYKMQSYHEEQIETSNLESSPSDSTLNYEIPEFNEAGFIINQAKLIKDICALKKAFDQFSTKFASEKPKEVVSKEIPDSKKKEKQAKKEKSLSNDKDTSSKSICKIFEYDTSAKDSAYKQSPDYKASNSYCLPPSLIKFKEQKNLPKKNVIVELPLTNSDWFDTMEAVAKKNNLPFDVKVVKSEKTSTPKASCEGVVAEGLVPVWKFLGSVLGIYSYESDVYSNTIDKFLNLFASHNDTGVSDNAWRAIGIHLGIYDTLSGAVEYSLVDIIGYGEFVKNSKEHANNCEIWANRVKTFI